jgi:hypothetical protein
MPPEVLNVLVIFGNIIVTNHSVNNLLEGKNVVRLSFFILFFT